MPEKQMIDFVFYKSVEDFVKACCIRNSPHRCDTGTMYETYCSWLSTSPIYKTQPPPSQRRFTRYLGNNPDLNPGGYRRVGGRLYYDNIAPSSLLPPSLPPLDSPEPSANEKAAAQ